jgi:hypothetical protein
MEVLMATWLQVLPLFFHAELLAPHKKKSKKVRQSKTKKDKEEKIVVGAIKRKERRVL